MNEGFLSACPDKNATAAELERALISAPPPVK
jgi:hypothetical protein